MTPKAESKKIQWRVTSGEKRDIVPGHGAILILAFFTRNLLLATRND